MPPQLSDSDAESDVSGTIPYRAKEKREAAREDEDDDDDDEQPNLAADSEDGDAEEYVVEKIEDHLWDDNEAEFRFKVRWQGYPKETDKTWEPIGNLATAKGAVKAYYKTIGFKPDPEDPNDRGWRGFRFEMKKRQASAAKSSSDDKPRKRKLSKSNNDAPTSGRRGRPKKKSRGDSSEEEASEDIVDAPSKKKALSYPPNASSWDSAITVVETIEALTDASTGEVINWGVVTWKNGQSEHTKHRIKVLHQRAPQRMLEFYERHLVFKQNPDDPNGQAGAGSEADDGAGEE